MQLWASLGPTEAFLGSMPYVFDLWISPHPADSVLGRFRPHEWQGPKPNESMWNHMYLRKNINGELKKDKHLAEQEEIQHRLSQKGYFCQFAVGFDEAKQIVDLKELVTSILMVSDLSRQRE